MRTNQTHNKANRHEQAQSLVEFAISLVLLLIILSGAVEVSLALFQYVSMRDAAQEAALFGSINPDDPTGMRNRAISAASDILALEEAEIVPSWSDSAHKCEGLTAGVPHSVTVTITHPHQIVIPFAGTFLPQEFNMTASVTDTILSPSCN